MSLAPIKKIGFALVVVIILATALAACGSSNSSSSESTESKTTGGETKPSGGETSTASEVAAAEKVVAPFIGRPSAFPVTEPLKKRPVGATFAYMDSGTPISGLLAELASGAAATLGVKFERVKAGTSASTVSAAFDSVVAQKPAAVLNNGLTPELWSKQLKELQAAGVPVVASAIMNGEKYGLDPVQGGPKETERSGKLMANYVIAHMDPEANAVIYEVPEVPLTVGIAESFASELESICSKCSVRTVDIPAEALGSTAPSTVVSDLQSHPETTVAAFGTDEVELGLPAALQAANIKVETLGYAPGPTNLQYLKEGKETAGLGGDLPVFAWTQIDQAAREATGQKLSGPEAEGLGVIQFLTKEDIKFDPSKGWTGYPEFAEKFAKLWGVGG